MGAFLTAALLHSREPAGAATQAATDLPTLVSMPAIEVPSTDLPPADLPFASAPGLGVAALPDQLFPEDVAESLRRTAEMRTRGYFEAAPGVLTPFWRAIDLQSSRPIVGVLFGDSHSANGAFAAELRRLMDGGRPQSEGFVTYGHPTVWDAKVTTVGRWRRDNWLHGRDQGPFGPMGIALSARDDGAELHLAWSQGDTSSVEISVLYAERGSRLGFSLHLPDGKVGARPPVRGRQIDDLGRFTVTVPSAPGSLTLRVECREACGGDEELRVFGFVLRRPGASVEWDVLAVGGTTMDNPRRRSDEDLERYLAFREPDLIAVWYGTNSAVSDSFEPARYRAGFIELLTRLRAAAPDAACLVLAPPDLARRPQGCQSARGRWRTDPASRAARHTAACDSALDGPCAWRTLPTVDTITRLQRDVALAQGCAWFDVFAYMGGPGSIQRWACGVPQLASLDFVHLTPRGYVEVARAVQSAIMAQRSLEALEPRQVGDP